MKTERKLSTNGIRELWKYLSYVFENAFSIETGLYFSTWCLNSFLYMGLTEAIFVPSEKELLSKFLFIILHKCESIMLSDSFANFCVIVTGPVAFLMFIIFSNLFMSETSVLSILKVSVNFRFFLISRILWCFSYFLMILRTASKLSSQFSKLFSTGYPEVFPTIFI